MDAGVVTETIRELVKRNRIKTKEAGISVSG